MEAPVPYYYFDVHDGDTHHLDDHGHEFPDKENARVEALASLPHIAKDQMPDGNRRDFIMDVRDESHKVIFTATLSLVARWVD